MEYARLEHDMQHMNRHVAAGFAAISTDPLVENLSIGVVLVDGEGVVRYLNHKAEQILQVGRDAVIGKCVYMLPLRTAIYKVLSENCRDIPIEMAMNGLVIQAKATSVLCGDGSCIGDMFELRDISTERQERRRSDEFVAAMTHDLKSPLTVMFGYLDALKNDADGQQGEQTQQYFSEIERNGRRLLGMIEDILDSYRLDMGLMQIQSESCNLTELMEECCQEHARDAEAHGLDFTYFIAPGIPMINADGKQLKRVFANLIGNAIKFTGCGGTVRVSVTVEGVAVLITVSDSGIGISARDRERIFTKYFRSTQAKGYKGTGLGLTISKAIIEEHGGNIEVASSEGAGSHFTIRLPVNSGR